MEKLVIIDGNSLINRAFYALPLLSNKNGEFSNAVFGFTTMLIKTIQEHTPTHIVVAFDYGKHTFRHDIYKEYKGTRHATPEELKSQFPILKRLLNAMHIKMFEIEGIEADDIIGTLSTIGFHYLGTWGEGVEFLLTFRQKLLPAGLELPTLTPPPRIL